MKRGLKWLSKVKRGCNGYIAVERVFKEVLEE